MSPLILVADAQFDGHRFHEDGPFTIEIIDGVIAQVLHGDAAAALAARHRHLHGDAARTARIPFVMPGMVEAHCHLFLDGAELDFARRKKHLSATREEMLAVGRCNLQRNVEAGITLVRDAGDLHGINTELKSEARSSGGPVPEIISAGRALRKKGRYGSFMAVEVTDPESIVRTIHELAPTADQLKILLTGIIDFEKGQMQGGPQFDLAETKRIVQTARQLGKRTFAHCSGMEGLKIAVKAGVDSIEHGFFMSRDILQAMADAGIVWVPTFSPVYFQYERPEHSGWNSETVAGLETILTNHLEHVGFASDIGVPILPGSDAGSYGVPHGKSVIDELMFLYRAGISVGQALAAATSLPRRLWGHAPADIAPGNTADLLGLDGAPFQSMDFLRQVRFVVKGASLPGVVQPLITENAMGKNANEHE